MLLICYSLPKSKRTVVFMIFFFYLFQQLMRDDASFCIIIINNIFGVSIVLDTLLVSCDVCSYVIWRQTRKRESGLEVGQTPRNIKNWSKKNPCLGFFHCRWCNWCMRWTCNKASESVVVEATSCLSLQLCVCRTLTQCFKREVKKIQHNYFFDNLVR